MHHVRLCQYHPLQLSSSRFLKPCISPTLLWKLTVTGFTTPPLLLCPFRSQEIATFLSANTFSSSNVSRFGSCWAAPRTIFCSSSSTNIIPLGEPADSKDEAEVDKLKELKSKVQALGINYEQFRPEFYQLLVCPKCRGGNLLERSLSFCVHVKKSRDFAAWRCFRTECDWAGQVSVDRQLNVEGNNNQSDTAKTVVLEPLSEKLLAYFSERMISKETLERNGVKQLSGSPNVIAFCYRNDGALVGCKYRSIDKKFWQMSGTQKTLYGVDDIKDASDIIIVEGELDKLSLEESGFQNCVSVPNGAPEKVSTRHLPPQEKDAGFQYIWNSKECLDKAFRIILATDSDSPGQALAEELARRLGKERCWRVSWAVDEGSGCYKDANEILVKLGPDAVRKAIESAVQYNSQD